MPRDNFVAPRVISQPTPGLYRVRLARKGVWVAATIRRESDSYTAEVCGIGVTWKGTAERLLAEVEGLLMEGRALNHPMLRISLFGIPIERTEWEFLTARREWAIQHAPEDPYANAAASIDLNELPPLF
jgi:hypothetical protein